MVPLIYVASGTHQLALAFVLRRCRCLAFRFGIRRRLVLDGNRGAVKQVARTEGITGGQDLPFELHGMVIR